MKKFTGSNKRISIVLPAATGWHMDEILSKTNETQSAMIRRLIEREWAQRFTDFRAAEAQVMAERD